MMLLKRIEDGCRVGFFGLGKSSLHLLRSLPLDKCRVTLRSDGEIDRTVIPTSIRVERILTGESGCAEINEDVLFLSPSVRREREELLKAKERGVILTSDAELFFEENRTPAFLVTGSDGKSTTATLINLLLNEAGYRSRLIGNIGEPMWQNPEDVYDFFVTELSSFMLTYLKPRGYAACITNITPNHLDWHKDYEEYRQTKLLVGDNSDRLIISDRNAEIKGAYGIISTERNLAELKKLYNAELYITCKNGYICRNGDRLISRGNIRRAEPHNLSNLMMAIAMTDGLVNVGHIERVAASFGGLSHRCETVLFKDGIEYIDSSIDSTPSRTVQTLKSLDRSVVLILGGRGKRVGYSELVPALKKYAARVIISGENAEEIYSVIKDEVSAEIIDDFCEAVRCGKEYARYVGVLLLSPASTSYDRFKNFAERGDAFKKTLLEK